MAKIIDEINKYMDFLRGIWWFILVGAGTYFIVQRYESIANGTAVLFDIIITLVWISLLAIPLFQEVNVYGVKFKKEIDTLKSDLREQMVNLRFDIQNSIDVRTQINPQIHVYPPSDSVLSQTKDDSKEFIRNFLPPQRIEFKGEKIKAPEKSIYLFTIRRELELELRRIWRGQIADEYTKRPINQMTRSLVSSGLINPRIGYIIQEVSSVCTPAIHGEEVTETQFSFVRDIAPELIASLKAIQ